MTSPRFSYARARLQARHAERLPAAVWSRLEASQSVEHFLEAARGTSLSRWLGRVDRQPGARAVESALELQFFEHVDDVADWVERPWDRSVRWTRWLPLLQRLEVRPTDDDVARISDAPDARVLLDGDASGDWLRRFRALWPRVGARGARTVVEIVARHLSAMREASADDDGWAMRAALSRSLEHRFRHDPAPPAVLFSHLGLTLLELERLRGAILTRLLLPRARGEASWA